MIRRVVVLGGTGFLGQVAGRHARAADLEVDLLGSKQVDLSKEEDLLALRDRVDDQTAILFAAALTRDVADDDESLRLNLLMAENVARFVRSCRPGFLAYLSSVSVYGRSTTNLSITEETPVDLDSRYAQAKHGGEEILKKAGVPLAIFRVCQVYGPTDTHVTYGPSRFLDTIRHGGHVTLFGDGEDRRDFLYENDFGQMVVEAISRESTGLLNLATGTSRTFAEVVEHLQQVVPTPFKVLHAPRKVPLVHQGFDTALLRSRLVRASFTPLLKGLQSTWEMGSRGKG